MGDNRLKCRKPLNTDHSLYCQLDLSSQNTHVCIDVIFCEITAILDRSPYWNIRHFGLVAVLECPPYGFGQRLEFTIILQLSFQFDAIRNRFSGVVLYSWSISDNRKLCVLKWC